MQISRYNGDMFEVRVEADFAAAHFLKDYHGKCENLHGHNYRVLVHAKGNELDSGGMLLDFSQLKSVLRMVCKSLDHTNLNDMIYFEDNPSAERIARYIFTEIHTLLTEQFPSDPHAAGMLYCIDVYETPTSRARYYGYSNN